MIQEAIEQVFSKQNRDHIVLGELLDSNWYATKQVNSAYQIIEHLERQHSNPDKNIRLAKVHEQFNDFDKVMALVDAIYVVTCQVYANIPIVSVAAMLAPRIKKLDIEDSILTMAEILAILGEQDLYDLYHSRNSQIAMRSRVKLSNEVTKELNLLMYLPPMISPPRIIEKNRDHYHYSLSDESMLLGGHLNHHNGNIGLDVLNTLSQQALSIDMDFVKQYKPIKPSKTIQKDWDLYMEQTDYVYSLLEGNDIYLTYKPDKRGRIYAQGHHVNSQGDDYHKAALELANKQYVVLGDL